MRQRVAAEVAKRVHLVAGIVDAADEGVLVGRATAGAVHVLAHDGVQVEQRVLLHARHEDVAGLLNGGVQRHGKRELLGLVRELADHRNNAAGGDREVACADAALLGVVQLAQRGERVVVVHEGFALTHEHDAGHAGVEVVAHVHDLVVDLGRGERARESGAAGRAERAAHGAAGLRAHADGELLAGGHADALDRRAVGEAQQVLAAAVLGDLAGNLLDAAEGQLARELSAKRLGKVGHVVEGGGVLVPDPILDLLDAEARLAEFLHKFDELTLGQRLEVAHAGGGVLGVVGIHIAPVYELSLQWSILSTGK